MLFEKQQLTSTVPAPHVALHCPLLMLTMSRLPQGPSPMGMMGLSWTQIRKSICSSNFGGLPPPCVSCRGRACISGGRISPARRARLLAFGSSAKVAGEWLCWLWPSDSLMRYCEVRGLWRSRAMHQKPKGHWHFFERVLVLIVGVVAGGLPARLQSIIQRKGGWPLEVVFWACLTRSQPVRTAYAWTASIRSSWLR